MHMLVMLVPILVLLYGFDLARIAARARTKSARRDSVTFDKVQRNAGSAPGYKTNAAFQQLEPEVFRAAAHLGGILTVSDAVLETGLPVNSARALLEQMTDGQHVCMEVAENGLVEFHFPEIRQRLSEQECPEA